MIEQKYILTLQWEFWQDVGNILCIYSNVSGNYTPITAVVLDVVLEERLAFTSLLTNNPDNLPMGRLFDECQYFLLPWFQHGMLINCTCWTWTCLYNFNAFLYSSVNDCSDKFSFVCKSVKTNFPASNFWRYSLSAEVIWSSILSNLGFTGSTDFFGQTLPWRLKVYARAKSFKQYAHLKQWLTTVRSSSLWQRSWWTFSLLDWL